MGHKCIPLSKPLHRKSISFSFINFLKIDQSIFIIICENNVILPMNGLGFLVKPKIIVLAKVRFLIFFRTLLTNFEIYNVREGFKKNGIFNVSIRIYIELGTLPVFR